MVKKIDIFGDGKNVYEEDKLPDIIKRDCGCVYSKDKNATVGIGYLLTKMCDTHKEKLEQDKVNYLKREEKRKKEELIKKEVIELMRSQAEESLKSKGLL